MTYQDQIHAKLLSLSSINSEGKREWTTQSMENFRQWMMKMLKRNSQARNNLINCPKKWNNTTQILEHFSKAYCLSVPFKIK
jgi:hypothetical protein